MPIDTANFVYGLFFWILGIIFIVIATLSLFTKIKIFRYYIPKSKITRYYYIAIEYIIGFLLISNGIYFQFFS